MKPPFGSRLVMQNWQTRGLNLPNCHFMQTLVPQTDIGKPRPKVNAAIQLLYSSENELPESDSCPNDSLKG